MDPTTSAHIDPSTLRTSAAGPDGTPELSVRPAASAQYSTGQSTHSTASSTSSSTPAATGLRQRVNKIGDQLDHASDRPAVKNAKGAAQNQIAQLRQMLGQSSLVRDFEARTGVDRVLLVVGGALA